MPYQLTPMMRHYMELKEKYPDCLLFYRLGDFYEMFFEDAEKASKTLDLVLTGRDCGLEKRAPMCGVPHHSVDNYIARLVDQGFKVAICEQLEDASQAKGLVERDVIRVITPGTVIEDKMLTGSESNYIAAIRYGDDQVGLSYADVSTGAFFTMEFFEKGAHISLLDELARIRPREILANEALFLQPFLSKRLTSQYYLEPFSAQAFLPERAKNRLMRHFGVASLDCFGLEKSPIALSAAGALMQYLEDTQKNALSHIHKITLLNRSGYMQLDVATRRNLELTQPLRQGGNKKFTLVSLLDQTKTSMGARRLRDWIERPLIHKDAIEYRLNGVEELFANLPVRQQIRELLSGMYDIERLSSKIVYGSIHAKDCLALKDTLAAIPDIVSLLSGFSSPALVQIQKFLDPMEDIKNLLEASIHPDAPANMKDGGYIRTGFHPEVDELRNIADSSMQWLKELEELEREKSGIAKLKVGYNRVFGYYFEVTKSNLSNVPYYFERRQTLTNAERFITPELKNLEGKILGAADRLLALEAQLFEEIRNRLLAVTKRLQENAAYLSELDNYQSFAEIAAANRYVKPQLNTAGRINIVNGRHPVIEQAQKNGFIPNDTLLDQKDNRLLIITGPNMAGKSTYMRQTALIALMAHIGSFVPADEADISILDRIFTRIGASDDLSAGQSTFMVEMSEMANILHNATDQSLLIIDEIGRGTSTFDGLSIAWSVLEFLADQIGVGQ